MSARILGPLLAPGLALLMSVPVAAADRDGDGLRDGFETRWGVTDPDKRDSDRDGVVDSAEDNDGDRLSNLGEQRFGTDPGDKDTDGDGKTDGREDADGNGLSNAREQDRRPLPRGLRPSLAQAPQDFSQGRFRCQTPPRESRIRPCKFGDTTSATRVVIFGDSHAAQWIPALDRAGEQEGWRIIQLTKSACPSASALVGQQYRFDRGRTCQEWRENAFGWLRKFPPQVIIISNRSNWKLIDAKGRTVPNSQRPQNWKKALAKTLAALPRRSEVIVLVDTPRIDGEPVPCLKRHRKNMSACVTSRTRALSSSVRKVERAAARAAGAWFRNLNYKICSYDPCPLVQGKTLVWRDHGHLTATFSRRLWPSLRNKMRKAVGAAAATSIAPAGRSR